MSFNYKIKMRRKAIIFPLIFCIILLSVFAVKEDYLLYSGDDVYVEDSELKVLHKGLTINCQYKKCDFELELKEKVSGDVCIDSSTLKFIHNGIEMPTYLDLPVNIETQTVSQSYDCSYYDCSEDFCETNFVNQTCSMEVEEPVNYYADWINNKNVCFKNSKTLTGYFVAPPETIGKYDVQISYNGVDYVIDPIFVTTGTDFDNGEYNKTMLDIDGYLKLTNNDSEQELDVNDGTFNYTDIIAYWKLNADGSNEINSSYNMSNFGADFVTGKLNNGVDFEEDENDIMNSTEFFKHNGGTGTYSFWVNLESRNIGSMGTVFKSYSYVVGNNGASDGFGIDFTCLNPCSSNTLIKPSVWSMPDGGNLAGASNFQDPITNVVLGSWQHHLITINSNTIDYWIDGVNVNNDTLSFAPDWTSAVKSQIGSFNFDGKIDELLIFDRELSNDEILDLYNRQKGEYINKGSYKSQDYGNIQSVTYEGVNNSGTTELNYTIDNYYFNLTGNGTHTPVIYNVTVDNSTSTTYTSIKHFDVEIDNLTFDSATPVTLSEIFFNVSKSQSFFSRGSFNTIKSNHPATTDLYMVEDINGVEKYDAIVRSLSLSSGWGIGNKPITNAVLNVGENNQTISVYDDAQGGVTISNFELHNLINVSEAGSDIDMVKFNDTFTFSSTTFEPVYNFTFDKSVSSKTILDITHKFSATGAVTPNCFINNSELTEVYGSYVPDASSTRSSGIAHKFNANLTQENFTIYCKGDNLETVTNTITVLMFPDKDIAGNLINSFENSQSNMTYTAGTHAIMNLTNFEVKGDGDELETIVTNVFSSLSGAQTVELYITMGDFEGPHYYRDLSDNNDLATSKVYSSYPFTVGDFVNGSMWVVVETGETLFIQSSSGMLYEASTLDTTTGNLPPIIDILAPLNDSNVSGTNQQINFSAVDTNDNLDKCILQILNDDETLNTTLSSDASSPFLINWTDYDPMLWYRINLSCNDTLGLSTQDQHRVYNNVGSLSNQLITDLTTEQTNVAFNVAHSFNCNDYDCNNVNRTVYFDSGNCLVQAPDSNSVLVDVTADTTYSENISVVCTTAETININISLYYVNNNLSITDAFVVEIAGGFGVEDESCLYTGQFTNGTLCAVGQAQAGFNMIGILGTLTGFMIFFLVLYFFGDSLNDYMGGTKWLSFLKPLYFIIAMGISYIILWTLGELASSYGIASNIVNVLQFLMIPYAIICVIIAIFIMLGFTEQATKLKEDKNSGRMK